MSNKPGTAGTAIVSTAADRARFERALALHATGKLREAERELEKLVRRNPDHFAALHLLGVIALQEKRFERAARLIGCSLELNPNDPLAHRNLGVALSCLKRFEESIPFFESAIALNPRLSDAHYNLGVAQNGLKRYKEALASYDAAIALDPRYVEALDNRGLVLNELQRPEEALKSIEQALALDSGRDRTHYNRGIVLTELARFDDALKSYRRAVALNPDLADAHWNMSFISLLKAEFSEGWRLYEWRKKTPENIAAHAYSQPEWRGEDLRGKTLFIHSEQGLGDTIQFCRFALLAESRGARVVFSVQDALMRLMESLSPVIEIVGHKSVPMDFDFYTALMSMPLAFGTDGRSIPANVPYLGAEPERVLRWKNELGDKGFKIGICWQGNKRASADIGRSFDLTEFRTISDIPGVRLISLQKNAGADQLKTMPAGMRVGSLGEGFDEGPDGFIDTAAVMQSLDLVITADTSIAHLGGALARPTWVVLKHFADWRWQLDRTDSPWYPTMRLFRQKERGDWNGVFAEIATAVENELRTRER